jgi:hypothetical protein
LETWFERQFCLWVLDLRSSVSGLLVGRVLIEYAALFEGTHFFFETLQGEHFQQAINGKYLKKYFPSVWQYALEVLWPVIGLLS